MDAVDTVLVESIVALNLDDSGVDSVGSVGSVSDHTSLLIDSSASADSSLGGYSNYAVLADSIVASNVDGDTTSTETHEFNMPSNPLATKADGTKMLLQPSYDHRGAFDDDGGFVVSFRNRLITNFACEVIGDAPATAGARREFVCVFSIFANCMGDFSQRQWLRFDLTPPNRLVFDPSAPKRARADVSTTRFLTDCFTARFLNADVRPTNVDGAIFFDLKHVPPSVDASPVQPLFKLASLRLRYAPRSEWDGHFLSLQATQRECSTQLEHNNAWRVKMASAHVETLPHASA